MRKEAISAERVRAIEEAWCRLRVNRLLRLARGMAAGEYRILLG
jgi:hypothetical protein